MAREKLWQNGAHLPMGIRDNKSNWYREYVW